MVLVVAILVSIPNNEENESEKPGSKVTSPTIKEEMAKPPALQKTTITSAILTTAKANTLITRTPLLPKVSIATPGIVK